MFIGHLAIGFAGKTAAPQMRIGTSIFAASLMDLLFPIFLIAGIEHVRIVPGITAVNPLSLDYYPWSHSLVSGLILAAVLGIVYYLFTKYRRGALWFGIAILSHWILDFISHIPDMPLWPGESPKVGLGLWNSVPATIAVEFSLFALCVFLYWRATTAKSIWGHVSLWLTVALLVFLYFAGFTAPPPPSADALKVIGFTGVLFVLMGYWMDRTRRSC